eukprot:4696391-Amphidinium_carterae.2
MFCLRVRNKLSSNQVITSAGKVMVLARGITILFVLVLAMIWDMEPPNLKPRPNECDIEAAVRGHA